MDNQNTISRRRFVELSALAAGSICLFPHCYKPVSKWRFFTNDEAKLMDAIADQIIPADEWPGGRESGVTNFIDKQLVGPYVRFQSKYRNGLLAIQDTCQNLYFKKFEELDFENQTLFLEMMEAGKMEGENWKEKFDREFFALVRDHSLQSYYGSPRHGGNNKNMSYKMLELDYPLIIGQNRYNN
jgi:gluconate 2-dehydrogenase gamma chain